MKIEKNIPMPRKNAGVAKYPWDALKVGESFVINGTSNAQQLCYQANRTRAPKQFESRILKGVKRVWRTA